MLKRMSKPLIGMFCVAILFATQSMAQDSQVQKVSAFYLAQGLPTAAEPAQLKPSPAPNLGNVPTPKVDLESAFEPTPAATKDGFQSANHPIFENQNQNSTAQPAPTPATEYSSQPQTVTTPDAPMIIEPQPVQTMEQPTYIIENTQTPITLDPGPAAVVGTGAGCSSGGNFSSADAAPQPGSYYVMMPEQTAAPAAGCSSGGILGTLKAKKGHCFGKKIGSCKKSHCGCSACQSNPQPVSACGCSACAAAPQPVEACGCSECSGGSGFALFGDIFKKGCAKKKHFQQACGCDGICSCEAAPVCNSCNAAPCSTCGPSVPCACGPPPCESRVAAPNAGGSCGFSFGKLKRGLFGNFGKGGCGLGGGCGSGACGSGACGLGSGGCVDGSCGMVVGNAGYCGGCGGGAGTCGCSDPCCPKFYGSAQYLLWWSSGMNLPSLVTTSPVGTPVTQAGLLGLAQTTTTFGGDQESLLHSGGRYTMGLNLDCNGCNRLEFNYLFLTDEGEDYERFGGANTAILARPFTNVFTGGQDAELVGFPGIVDGRIRVDTSTDFQSFGVMWRHNLCCCKPCGGGGGIGPCFSCRDACGGGCGGGLGLCGPTGGCFKTHGVELLIGYRHLELADQVRIEENLTTTATNGDPPLGTTFDIVDQFRTENKFDGVDLGLNWEGGKQRWGLGLIGKVAFGRTRTQSIINGSTVITTTDNQVAVNSGGLLALDSNIGVYDDERFSAIPEFGAYLYYCLGNHGRFRFGYNMIYWSDVTRASGIIDTNVDPRLLPPVVSPNAGRPQFVANREDFWAQGLTFGFDFCF